MKSRGRKKRIGWALATIALLAGLDWEAGAQPASQASGIQWYATWESGLREAQRTGRPILLISAAPHCAGVSGMW